MGKKIYIGDTGTELILDTNEDITGSTVSIEVKKGDGTIDEWTGCTIYDTTKVKYVLDSDDLNCAGIYKVQAHVTLLSGWSGLGETAEFQVYDVFE